MLVGVDHIAYTASELDEHDRALRRSGYDRAFVHEGIPNPPNKRDLMHRWPDDHTLALYMSADSLPLEIIDYGYSVDCVPRFIPISDDDIEATGNAISEVASTAPGGAIGSGHFRFHTVVSRTADVGASKAFWERLGFSHEGGSSLRFDPPIGEHALSILLEEETLAGEPTPLDGCGYTCIAFVSSSLEGDLERLAEGGYASTDIEQVDFPDRSLRVAFVVGPAGEPVELVSPVRD